MVSATFFSPSYSSLSISCGSNEKNLHEMCLKHFTPFRGLCTIFTMDLKIIMRMLIAGKMFKIKSEFEVTFFRDLANLTLTPSTGCAKTYVRLTWTGRNLVLTCKPLT